MPRLMRVVHVDTTDKSKRSESRRRPLIRFLTRTTVFWLAATMVGLALSSRVSLGDFSVSDLHLGKCFLYYALLLGVAAIPGFANYWRNASAHEKRFIGVITFCLLVGQTAGESRKLFPFVEWDMYSQVIPNEPTMVVQYVGVTEKGDRVLLNPAQIVPALGRGTLRITNGMQNLVRGALSAEGNEEQQKDYRWRMQESLGAIQRLYNKKWPHSPITDVEVYLSYVDPRAPMSPRPRSRGYSTNNATITTQ